jgi:hypothetical protein
LREGKREIGKNEMSARVSEKRERVCNTVIGE